MNPIVATTTAKPTAAGPTTCTTKAHDHDEDGADDYDHDDDTLLILSQIIESWSSRTPKQQQATNHQKQQNGAPATLFNVTISSAGTDPLHSKRLEASTNKPRQILSVCCEQFAKTGNGPRPMHSGPQDKSELCVQRDERTHGQCRCHCHCLNMGLPDTAPLTQAYARVQSKRLMGAAIGLIRSWSHVSHNSERTTRIVSE